MFVSVCYRGSLGISEGLVSSFPCRALVTYETGMNLLLTPRFACEHQTFYANMMLCGVLVCVP